jgi:hypothetical protein
MTSPNVPGFRSGGPGEAQGAGGSAPKSSSAMRPGIWGPLDQLEMWQNQLKGVQLMLETGHTATAMHELNDLLRQMSVVHENESKPSEDVQRALGALRVLVRDLPAWKAATVKLFLHGVRPHDLRQLTMSQCRVVVWDLAATLSTLERGGAS